MAFHVTHKTRRVEFVVENCDFSTHHAAVPDTQNASSPSLRCFQSIFSACRVVPLYTILEPPRFVVQYDLGMVDRCFLVICVCFLANRALSNGRYDG